MRKIMGPLSLSAILLLATFSLARAAETIQLQIVGDAHQKFQAMINNKQLKEGMNLVLTNPSGEKVWADVKKEGQLVAVDWVITDRSDKKLATSALSISNVQPGTPRSEEKWYRCTEPKNGPRQCTEVPCVPKFPYPHVLGK